MRNAYSLMGSTLTNSAVGLLFWVVAARKFSKADVGIDSALITTMAFLSNLSQLNLANGFNRFVPTAGRSTRRFVLLGYAVTVVVSVLAAIVFLAGVHVWAARLAFLTEHRAQATWFIVATALWTIFVLEDAVLTGLGEAHWVLVENGLYGIIKLGVLAVLAMHAARFGLFSAWTFPLIALIVPVNWLLFVRLIPRRTEAPLERIDVRSVARPIAVDYVSSLLTTVSYGVWPLLVLSISGAEANASVSLAWTIAYTLHLLSNNVGMAMITEASREPERILEHTRKAIWHGLRIVVPLALLTVVAAPVVLPLIRSSYGNGTRPLQFFALAAIPNVFIVTYVSVARVRRRMGLVVAVTAVQTVSILVLVAVFLHVVGLAGVGLAWVVVDTVLAIVLLLGELRALWLPRLHSATLPSLLAPRPDGTGRTRRPARQSAERAFAISGLADSGWTVGPFEEHTRGVCRAAAANTTTGERATFKAAVDATGPEKLAREVGALASIGDEAGPRFCAILPRVVASDAQASWSLVRAPEGDDASRLDATAGRAVAVDVAARMIELYTSSTSMGGVGDEYLSSVVDAPLLATEALHVTRVALLHEPGQLRDLRAELHRELSGRDLTIARTHGNLWLGSITIDGAHEIAGIVDWYRSALEPPVLDVAHLLTTTRALATGRELGAVVREVLERGAWEQDDLEVIRAVPGADELGVRTTLLLVWLRHIGDKITRRGRLGTQEVWLAHNVHEVLESL